MTVLAVATDDQETRNRIPAFLKKQRLSLKVLLDDRKNRAGYEVNGVPALYVIDRQGWIAGVPAESLGSDEKRLEEVLGALLDGKPPERRTLVTLQKAPPGWGELWLAPVEERIEALTIGSPVGNTGGEVGALSGVNLARWSVTGEALGEWNLRQPYGQIFGADLDGNGKREWIVSGEILTVMDQDGERYWSVGGADEVARNAAVLAVQSGKRDRAGEILMRNGDYVTRWNYIASPVWQKDGLRESAAVLAGPGNTLLVQSKGRVEVLNWEGRRLDSNPAPPFCQLKGRLQRDEKHFQEFFGDPDAYNQVIETRYDLDGDGANDLLLVDPPALVAYDASGNLLLQMEVNGQNFFPAAVGDLDGRPGAEIVVAVPNYGLVALGRGGAPPDAPRADRPAAPRTGP
ncbi:MAG: hypothetical protein L0191_19625 [Acidobacteria bacterium]|nr:hypothetical protein [Acidobacteriota bacterium]